MTTTEKLINMGGCEWRGGQNHRVYFNTDVCAKLIGLEYQTYKTGNISYAKLNGDEISNSRARDIKNEIETANLYFNVSDEKFYFKSRGSADYIETIVNAIRATL